MDRIPAKGLVGETAIREAAAGSFQELLGLIRAALQAKLQLSGDMEPWPFVRALFADSLVVEREGKLERYPYTVGADKTVTLGEPTLVEETFEPAGTTKTISPGAFIEGVGDRGSGRWRIRVIRAGVSGNNNFYPDRVLREAVRLFDGARVFVKSDEEHLAGRGKDVRNLIGGLSDPAFVEGKAADSGEVQATLQLIEPDGPVASKLREAWDRGLTRLFGFSIDAQGPARRINRAGRQLREARSISKVHSVDLIVEPGAGGEVINLIEAKRETIMDRDEIIALIEASRPDLLKGKKTDELTDDELKAIFTEAVKRPEPEQPEKDEKPAGLSADEVDERLRMVEARGTMRAAIAESKLPDAAKKKLRERFDKAERFTEAEVEQAIKDEAEYLAQFTESGAVRGMGDDIRIEPGESRAEKVADMLDAFFDPQHKDHKHARSFRECYISITGDRRVTGRLDACDEARLRESLGTGDFTSVLGDSITRRMIADYRAPSVYDIWRQIATVGNATDFRTQERTRFGGYGDLPIVAQAGDYLPVTSPTDEKATFAVAKRGGTEDVTLEMIKNDDAGAIARIPTKLSRAAKRTLSKFVLDFIKDNPLIYDGLALFVAGHNNLGAAALDATTLAAGRLAMLQQTEKDSLDRLNIGPRSILVPTDLEETAVDLFRRTTENDKTFTQSLALDVLPVWYWTDINDWALVADPMDIPTIEVGFLDGDEEPALFVQDNPTVGSMFSADKLTWKIRHIYGGSVLDFRAFYKAVVP